MQGAPQHSPVLEGSPGVLAAAHVDHEQGEEEEKGCGSEAHAVDGTVAEQGATIDMALQDDGGPGPLITHPWQLWGQTLPLDGPILPGPDSAKACPEEAFPAGAGPGGGLPSGGGARRRPSQQGWA